MPEPESEPSDESRPVSGPRGGNGNNPWWLAIILAVIAIAGPITIAILNKSSTDDGAGGKCTIGADTSWLEPKKSIKVWSNCPNPKAEEIDWPFSQP
jgi:hypothetical protein